MAISESFGGFNPSKIKTSKQVIAVIVALAIVPVSGSITLDDTIFVKSAIIVGLFALAFYILWSDQRTTDSNSAIINAVQYIKAQVDFLEDLIDEFEGKLISSTGERHDAYQEVLDLLNTRLRQVKLIYNNTVTN